MHRILVVEDDELLRKGLLTLLSKDYFVEAAATLAKARELLAGSRFDLILLDMVLPDGEGSKLCAFVQESEELARGTPVIFLSGRGEMDDKVMAFALGADDYILKPFDPRELTARIQSRLKKTHRAKEMEQFLVVGDLKLSIQHQKVFIVRDGGELEVDLTQLEFKLLHYFVRHEDHVLSRNQLLEAVWGHNTHVVDRTVDAHISNLRKKIESGSHTIKTRHGAGYIFTQFEACSAKRA